jgi:ferredoxin
MTVHAVYFSPTHSTKKTTEAIAQAIATARGEQPRSWDMTLPAKRAGQLNALEADVLVLGFPVYYGRVPQPMAAMLEDFSGHNTPLVLVACYGNRHYDNSLLEAANTMAARGFVPVAAFAQPCEHSFTANVAPGRPTAADLQAAAAFGTTVAEKCAGPTPAAITLPGTLPLPDIPAIPWKSMPLEACSQCGTCVELCPTGAIDVSDVSEVSADCIGCAACVKGCPQRARVLDPNIVTPMIEQLEAGCSARREAEGFV